MKKPWADVLADTEVAARETRRNVASLIGASMPRARVAAAALAALLIAGCVVGPDFKRPAAPDVNGYAAHPPSKTDATANVAGGEAQHFAAGVDLPADWWTLFHSKPLNDLIEQSLANNPDLKAAQAALTAARENTLAGRGAYYPSVAAGISASRQQDPPGALAPVPSTNAFLYNLFTPNVSVSYAPDLFGLNRRTVESLQAQEQAVRFQMAATHITLSTNVVVAVVQLASLQAQVDTTRELIGTTTRMLDILREQLAKGYVGRLDVAAQESQLAQTNAALPPLLQATGPAARSAGGAGRSLSEPGAAADVRAVESAVA